MTYASNTHTVCTLSAQCRALHRMCCRLSLSKNPTTVSNNGKRNLHTISFVLPFYSSAVPHLLISRKKLKKKKKHKRQEIIKLLVYTQTVCIARIDSLSAFASMSGTKKNDRTDENHRLTPSRTKTNCV